MPAVLRDHQHEILDLAETRSLVFGTEDTGYLTLVPPAISGAEIRAADVERPQEDGIAFGRDYRGPKSITFEIGALTDKRSGLDGDDVWRANLDYLDHFEGWWLDERLRNHPQAMAVLRSREAGQTWRAYGRPRRYEASRGRLNQRGYTPLVCDFALADGRFYSDAEFSTTVGLAPALQGGLSEPLVAPLTSAPAAEGTRTIQVAGKVATWPWVRFDGPVTNPSVTIGDLFIGLVVSLAHGQSITVDPRPWSRSVLRENGGNAAGVLDPRTPQLRRCLIYPGSYQAVYRGTDITATSTVTVFWRNARNHP
jgi:hypothetical protein